MRSSIRRHLTSLVRGKLARASAWLFVGGIAGGILGYVFQVLMGRMLSPQEYGLFSAIMALFMVLAAPLGTLMMVVSRKVSEYRARQDKGSIRHLYHSINIRAAVVGAVILGICYFVAPQIQAYLKAPSLVPVFLLGAILFFTFPPIINNAFLQGLQNFTWLSASGSLGVLLKIGFAVLLVWLGYGVAGALGGTILAALAVWIITYAALHRPLAEGRGAAFETAHFSFKSALPVLIANVAFAAMTQLDMVFVNYYFPAHDAGLYAAASTLGKAVMYLPGGITMALFPMVAEHHARDEGSAHLLLQAVGLTALLCGAGAVFYFFLGEWVITLLYGESYLGAGEILKYYGFAIFPMALVMVAENFLIAKGKVLFAYLFAVVMPLQLTAIYFYHSSLLMVVVIIGASSLLLALLGYGLLWRAFRKST
ncbi:MAG: oligosaccharide flippase family protein [Thiobacillus sp.]|nr:oligosaccharide flippase family protein [Thiobacillus sp.]